MSVCLHPTFVHDNIFPCGKCPVCLQNKRQALSTRFLLEAAYSGGTTFFVTLTYDDDHLPFYNGVPSFDKRQVQLFLKSLRSPYNVILYDIPKFLYFITSEYGDRTLRPHYHGIFFCRSKVDIIHFQQILEKFWSFGFVTISLANDNRLAYAAKYCLKDSTNFIPDLPNGHPLKPFRLFSSRPGIGSSAIPFINEFIYNNGTNHNNFIKVNGKSIVFDTYIKRHIDPSLLADLQADTYYLYRNDIFQRLRNSWLSHSKEIFDPIQKKYKKVFDYSEDNRILRRRNDIKFLKRSKL